MSQPARSSNDVAPVIVPSASFPVHALHGEGSIRRAIYPDLTGSVQLFVGVAEFAPGTAPHVFHRHGTEVVGADGARRRLTYAQEFEEFYYVIEGSGEMQWRLGEGEVRVAPVQAGDAVYFPRGVAEHRVFNTGTSRMRVLYGGTPPASVELID